MIAARAIETDRSRWSPVSIRLNPMRMSTNQMSVRAKQAIVTDLRPGPEAKWDNADAEDSIRLAANGVRTIMGRSVESDTANTRRDSIPTMTEGRSTVPRNLALPVTRGDRERPPLAGDLRCADGQGDQPSCGYDDQ